MSLSQPDLLAGARTFSYPKHVLLDDDEVTVLLLEVRARLDQASVLLSSCRIAVLCTTARKHTTVECCSWCALRLVRC